MTHRLIAAARRQPLDRPPVWIMRQAGRYMPEFRALRAKHDFLTVCRTPELACEVTLQPLEPIGVDAAILFSDILVPLAPMGMQVRFDGHGPHLDNPIRELADVKALRPIDPAADTAYVGEAIRMVKRELAGRLPLIGFAGSPWTLASYMIEGGGSKTYANTKRMMYRAPEAFAALTDHLATALVGYLNYQIEAGCDVVQLFESWGGVLSPADFRRYALPAIRKVIAGVKPSGVPVVLYMNGAGHVLEDLVEAGADVVGVDWRVDLPAAIAAYGDRVAFQGNLDPGLLYADEERIAAEVRALHEAIGGRPGHIFNLGHGIQPDTPVAGAQAFVRAVKELAHVATRA